MAQFTPPPGPGQAPFQPPTGPRGPYGPFGMPDTLVAIHFPTNLNNNPSTANPWYWWYPTQQPFEFSFLGGVWGPGWLRLPDFSIIKILASDTQVLTPIPRVGRATLEQAVTQLQPDQAFGRIDFRDKRFWGLVTQNGQQNLGMPAAMPKFDQVKGQIKARDNKTNINKLVAQAAQRWATDWNGEAVQYNALASKVSPTGGFQYPGQAGLFSIPIPDGPPTTISRLQFQLEAFVNGPPFAKGAAYLGPIPATALFNINTLTTSAYAFNIQVGQLDPKKWNMSVFPPLDSTLPGNGASSAVSGDYSGFGQTPFLFSGASN